MRSKVAPTAGVYIYADFITSYTTQKHRLSETIPQPYNPLNIKPGKNGWPVKWEGHSRFSHEG
jgi:hypothetical protein